MKRLSEFPTDVLFVSATLIGLPILASYLLLDSSKQLSRLQSGEHTLICNITGQYEAVHPSKIKDRIDDMYIFTNGYSKTCNVLKTPYNE